MDTEVINCDRHAAYHGGCYHSQSMAEPSSVAKSTPQFQPSKALLNAVLGTSAGHMNCILSYQTRRWGKGIFAVSGVFKSLHYRLCCRMDLVWEPSG